VAFPVDIKCFFVCDSYGEICLKINIKYLMYGVFRYVLWFGNTVSMKSVTVMMIIMGWVMYSHL
jgi:hypothetical protein